MIYNIEATCPKYLSLALKVIHLHKDKVNKFIDTEINENKMTYKITIEGDEETIEKIKYEYMVMKS